MAGKPAPGVYMPPFRLAQLMAAEAAQDKTGPQYQRLTWDALRKSINALVNKVTAQNIKNILHELFREVRHLVPWQTCWRCTFAALTLLARDLRA